MVVNDRGAASKLSCCRLTNNRTRDFGIQNGSRTNARLLFGKKCNYFLMCH
jgi:hypothetical protein